MPLTDARSKAIAARVSSLAAERGRVLPRQLRQIVRGLGQQTSALRKARQYEVTGGAGPSSSREAKVLDLLVGRREVTAQEAAEFLAARYPTQRWTGGRFADRSTALTGASSKPKSAPDITVPRLPEQYDRAATQRAIEGLAHEASARIDSLRTRPIELESGTVDGAALRPGSVPVEALDLRAVGGELLSWPGPDEAIGVSAAISGTMDRFVRRASTGDTGPARIWEARDVLPSPRSRIGVGPARYRIVQSGQRFGVMSCRLPPTADMGATPLVGMLVQYGIVLARIQHFLGRPPTRLLGLETVGDSPVSYRGLFLTGNASGGVWATGGTTRDCYWRRSQSEHVDLSSYPFADAFGSDSALSPSAASIRDCAGFTVELITGRDTGEVFRQLCSRKTLGRSIRLDGHGPSVSCPPGLVAEAPAPVGVVDLQSPFTYTHLIEGADLTASGIRIVQGVPFAYKDCAALVPDETHFSVVIQAVEKTFSTSPLPSAWGTPEVWSRNGFVTVAPTSGRLRTWALDLIIS